jgi:hypothetical protein
MSDTPRYWKPLQQVDRAEYGWREQTIEHAMKVYELSRDQTLERLTREEAGTELWRNDLYQVQVRRHDEGFVHINIRRIDGRADLRDWRHFQQIKNEILGPECEAIELYPAESRKWDASNKFHLFGSSDPTFRFPVGFESRDVQYDEAPDVPGMRQRSL